ncbi:unnamed protein product, partial [Phaeothamnion confervicola]
DAQFSFTKDVGGISFATTAATILAVHARQCAAEPPGAKPEEWSACQADSDLEAFLGPGIIRNGIELSPKVLLVGPQPFELRDFILGFCAEMDGDRPEWILQ